MMRPIAWRLCLLVSATLAAPVVHSGQFLVGTKAEYERVAATVQAGDTIVLGNGVWRDFEIVLSGRGTAEQPITLTAETKGRVLISGRSNLRMAGEHLVVSGLVFTDGHTPTNEVISFRGSRDELANNSRVTEVVIDGFNNPERFETDFWVMMYGQNNRFDHNYLAGKSNAGVTMAVRLNSEASQNNRHRIDHNYFGPRPVLGANGGETLRIGTSKYSLSESKTRVENNYFDRCNGELEIISVKAGRNVVRGNVFYESRGTLTLRHGNDNLLEDNIFFGNRVDHTGGIRVINKRQTVRNNYMYGLAGYRFGGALVVMNGVPDSPINRYHQVEDSIIENNSIINSEHVEFAAGSDSERSAVPITSVFRNNLIVNDPAAESITVHDDVSGIRFEGNITNGVEALPISSGFTQRDLTLVERPNGLLYPASRALARVGVKGGIKVLTREDTGPSWYAKPADGGPFGGGRKTVIEPGQDTLTRAIEQSGPGDVIELSSGQYIVTKLLVLQHPVSVRAGDGSHPQVQFERSTLFELADGASLELDGLLIDGSAAPDAYGNSVIRTSRYSMLNNYEIRVADTEVKNLNTNHSFNFLRVSRHTFADRIDIRDSSMQDISGHVVALDREIDDLGIYNGEYINITRSRFARIGGALATIYRGGTDESTFGPHVRIEHCELVSVGNSKRNKTKASVFLQGVQVALVADNTFLDSAPVRVVRTVADPITRIERNQRTRTEAALVTDWER